MRLAGHEIPSRSLCTSTTSLERHLHTAHGIPIPLRERRGEGVVPSGVGIVVGGGGRGRGRGRGRGTSTPPRKMRKVGSTSATAVGSPSPSSPSPSYRRSYHKGGKAGVGEEEKGKIDYAVFRWLTEGNLPYSFIHEGRLDKLLVQVMNE